MGFESAASALHARHRKLGRCPCDSATLIDLLRKSRARTFIRVVKRTLIAFVYDWEEHNQRRAKEFASANKSWPSTLQILCFSVN